MLIQLREIIYSDNSKQRSLVINSDKGAGRIKVSLKEWKLLEKLGITSDKMNVSATKQELKNNH